MGVIQRELNLLDPLRSFHEQLAEEVESYERLKRGDLGEPNTKAMAVFDTLALLAQKITVS